MLFRSDEDALLQRAFALSMGDLDSSVMRQEEDSELPKTRPVPSQSKDFENEHLSDVSYVNSIVTSLPGVNPEDGLMQETLEKAHQDRSSEEDKD